jgi:hypothetical protein
MQKPIFISHAIKDAAMVGHLVDALVASGVANVDDIFCSSLQGMGIPAGQNFISFIKDQLTGSKLVVVVLTENYYASPFCLCELGAVWALAQDFFPLLVPPLTYNDLKAVLVGVQVETINEKKSLNDLKDRIAQKLGKVVNSTRWENKRDSFIATVPVPPSGKATPTP